jgi:hypothetical protein
VEISAKGEIKNSWTSVSAAAKAVGVAPATLIGSIDKGTPIHLRTFAYKDTMDDAVGHLVHNPPADPPARAAIAAAAGTQAPPSPSAFFAALSSMAIGHQQLVVENLSVEISGSATTITAARITFSARGEAGGGQ